MSLMTSLIRQANMLCESSPSGQRQGGLEKDGAYCSILGHIRGQDDYEYDSSHGDQNADVVRGDPIGEKISKEGKDHAVV